MAEGPYDYARERWEAREEAERRGVGTRMIGGVEYDDADVPDPADLDD